MTVPDHHNRTDWLTPFLAFAVWAAHFSLLWAASVIFPGQPAARWLAVALTVPALGAMVWLWQRAGVRSVRTMTGLSIALAAGAVLFGLAPAIVG